MKAVADETISYKTFQHLWRVGYSFFGSIIKGSPNTIHLGNDGERQYLSRCLFDKVPAVSGVPDEAQALLEIKLYQGMKSPDYLYLGTPGWWCDAGNLDKYFIAAKEVLDESGGGL